MTVLLFVAVATASATAGATAMWLACERRVDAHHYRRVHLETVRVDRLYNDNDHNFRLARRLEARCRALRTANTDLIRTIATMAQATRTPTPRHLRPSPIPRYGRWAS